MVRIVSFVWTLTALFFLVSLAYIYANVGEVVNLDGSMRSISEYSLRRGPFFFTMLGVFMVINIIFRGFGYLLQRVPVATLNRPSFFPSQAFKDQLVTWVVSFSAIINISISFSVIIIGFANYAVNPRSTAIGGFSYVGLALMIGWIAWLVVILFRRKSLK